MELSAFLAKLFGVYLLMVSALWALRGEAFADVLEEFFAQRALVFFSGLLALAVGIAMVVSHSVWELSWRGAITLIGYVSVAKGIARIAFPDKLPKVASRAIRCPGKWVWIAITLAIGAWLAWAGFAGG